MKWLQFYDSKNLTTEDEVFDYLCGTLRPGVADWNYYVDWNKVFTNTREIEVTLNTLNYLLGKDNFAAEFKYLAAQNPSILKAIPVLIVRDGSKSTHYSVLTVDGTLLQTEEYEFNLTDPSTQDIERAIDFIERSGLIRIFKKDGVKNLVDYVFGVEAGLSSNGRKNRAGTAMENISETLIKNMGYDYISQASTAAIKAKFNIDIKVTGDRKFDFALVAENGLNIFEVNSFSSGGSKLDKTASDFRGLQDELRGQATFVWFTDGAGWKKVNKPLRVAFHHNDHILNTQMVEGGALREILHAK